MNYSTDNLYDIICSGITETTRFSFTSSNSSFTECERTHNSSPHTYLGTNSNDDEQNGEGKDFGNKQVVLDHSSTHNFISCLWRNCLAALGGAISFRSLTESSLIMNKCTFYSCGSSSSSVWTDGGGAISAFNVRSVSLSGCLFVSCSHTSGSGGGINMYTILHQAYINYCVFISCSAWDDGGCAAIWDSKALDNPIACLNCRFIKGTAKGSGSGSGGHLIFFNTYYIACSNCLFSDSEADLGAFYFLYSSYCSGKYPLIFSFFNNNSAAKHGNDAALDNYAPNDNNPLFLHCASTSSPNRVGFWYNNRWDKTDVIWLPLNNIVSTYLIFISLLMKHEQVKVRL